MSGSLYTTTKAAQTFVITGNAPALPGMPDIEILDILSVKFNTIAEADP